MGKTTGAKAEKYFNWGFCKNFIFINYRYTNFFTFLFECTNYRVLYIYLVFVLHAFALSNQTNFTDKLLFTISLYI